MIHFKKVWLLLFSLLLMVPTAWGQDDDGLDSLRQRDDFVTASLLVSTPGVEVYSVLGHCVVRMECPTYDLDYCFSFEIYKSTTLADFMRFFGRQISAGFMNYKTSEYLKECKEEGRGVVQWTLNLTPSQKQELWRYLDKKAEDGPSHQFDFVSQNCTFLSFTAVESQLQGERLVVKSWPEAMRRNVRASDGCYYYFRYSRWLQFVLMTIGGTEADVVEPIDHYIAPEMVGQVLQQSVIVSNNGSERPALLGDPVTLLPQTSYNSLAWLSPVKFFLMLLLIVVLVTVGEWRFGWKRAAQVLDAVLLTVQALAGVLLLYFALVSCVFGLNWNWCLIIFNPLPLLLWLFGRRCGWASRLWLFYAVVLLLFGAVLPFFTTQIMVAHRLIALALSVRYASLWKIFKKK